jgi:hypothetical protein
MERAVGAHDAFIELLAVLEKLMAGRLVGCGVHPTSSVLEFQEYFEARTRRRRCWVDREASPEDARHFLAERPAEGVEVMDTHPPHDPVMGMRERWRHRMRHPVVMGRRQSNIAHEAPLDAPPDRAMGS